MVWPQTRVVVTTCQQLLFGVYRTKRGTYMLLPFISTTLSLLLWIKNLHNLLVGHKFKMKHLKCIENKYPKENYLYCWATMRLP